MTSNTPLEQNLIRVRDAIEASCRSHDREPSSLVLLAVSKTKPLAMIQSAMSCGQQHFGENYLQEALEKIDQLSDQPLNWHFIGAIQSNKTRPIAEHFDWVHTVCSEKVGIRLNKQRPAELPKLNVLLQINIDNENSKSGLSPSELLPMIETLQPLDKIELRGLMAIPKASDDVTEQRSSFAALRNLKDEVNRHFDLRAFDQLSMGMSGDLDAAIAEGATMVRIGTAIFGKREAKK